MGTTCNVYRQSLSLSRALRHIRPALDSNTAEVIGRVIVQSRMDYCNSLLINMTESNYDRLQRMQNGLVRVMRNLSYRSHVSGARRRLHRLPIRERVRYKLSTLVYKTRHMHRPVYLDDLLRNFVPARVTRSCSDVSRVVEPQSRGKLITKAFNHAAPAVWNSLPRTIRESSITFIFKKQLKHFFVLLMSAI